ncbi:MAG: enoyl-CoA hydratase/isomerase family protein [Chloroflexi bacterium]|nr:enoyl-CoA hydratase/isomerase family protein [Chloroflexota bacterium]
MADYKWIKVSQTPGMMHIALDHPPLNILDIATMTEVNRVLDSLDPTVKVVVFSGQGRAFSAGVDVQEHRGENVGPMIAVFHGMFRRMAALPQVTVAAVHGAVLGGGSEFALFCDLVVAAESAKIGQPEIKLGAFPPISVILLPRLIGRKKALELLLTGDSVTAQEAWRLGLVNQVVPDDQLQAATDALVAKLVAHSAPVLALAKKAIRQAVDADFGPVLDRVEALYLQELANLPDYDEGLLSFLEKRPPVWQER